MQALERAAPDLPLSHKGVRRRECNYIRHGTQSLIAGLNVAGGQVYAWVGDTRTEEDFVSFIDYVVSSEPDESRKFVFTLDQLNTHKSASLVRLMARLNGDEQDLGRKGHSGILKSMVSRMEYLEARPSTATRQTQRVRFVFTPKHCSWLNVIEGWFSALQRRVLQLGNFVSQDDLAQRVIHYVDHYNKVWAKTVNWTKAKKADVEALVEKVKRMVTLIAG